MFYSCRLGKITLKEMMISTISSAGKGDSKVIKDTPATIGDNAAK